MSLKYIRKYLIDKQVIVDLGIGTLPSGNKPLPEPM